MTTFTKPGPLENIRRALNRPAVQRGFVLLILLLGAGLRFHNLPAQSLWNDEGVSVVMTRRSLPEILTHTAADIHPPGYYVLLAGWAQLAGRSELALRSLSALQSLLTLALTIAAARRLFGNDAGLLAGLLLAVNTFAIYYAQEARMYAQLALFSALGMWVLITWLTDFGMARAGLRPAPSRRKQTLYAVGLALTNAAGLYTQYFYPFMLLVQGVVFLLWLWRQRQRRQPAITGRTLGLFAGTQIIALLLFLPWAPTAIQQVTSWPNTGADAALTVVVDTLIYGPIAPANSAFNGPGFTGPGILGLLIFGAVALSLATNEAGARIPVVWASLPVIAFLLLGLAEDDIKSLLPVTSAAVIWLAVGATLLWRNLRLMNYVLVLLGGLTMIPALAGGLDLLYNAEVYQRNDYRAMAAFVGANAGPQDAVILNGPGQGEVWGYYADALSPEVPYYPLPRGLGGDDAATEAEVSRILQAHRRVYVLFWGEAERDPNRVVESTLDSQTFEVSTAWYGDVRFVTYTAPDAAATIPTETLAIPFGDDIVLTGYALSDRTLRAGDALTLTLFWQARAPLDRRYKVFVHLYADPAAPPPAQRDSEPGGGLLPTVDWQPGETVIDRHGILLPPDLPPGAYTLAVGLYDAGDPQLRLPTTSEDGERYPLAALQITGG